MPAIMPTTADTKSMMHHMTNVAKHPSSWTTHPLLEQTQLYSSNTVYFRNKPTAIKGPHTMMNRHCSSTVGWQWISCITGGFNSFVVSELLCGTIFATRSDWACFASADIPDSMSASDTFIVQTVRAAEGVLSRVHFIFTRACPIGITDVACHVLLAI